MNQDHPNRSRRAPRTRPAALASPLLLAVPLALLGAAAPAQDAASERIDAARAALEKWVESRRVLSAEKRDWALGKEVLEGRIELVKREIESLRGRIADAERSIAEADRKKEELAAENERLKEAASALSGEAGPLEARLKALLPRLPDPIRENVKPLSQRLPDDPAATKLSLGQRFQNVVGILNAVNKFNREVTVASEVRTLGDGTQAEVTALYLGIGQGYFANAKGDAAGAATASPEGWTWAPADEAAARIARAIAMFKNEQVAAFVPLPVRVK